MTLEARYMSDLMFRMPIWLREARVYAESLQERKERPEVWLDRWFNHVEDKPQPPRIVLLPAHDEVEVSPREAERRQEVERIIAEVRVRVEEILARALILGERIWA